MDIRTTFFGKFTYLIICGTLILPLASCGSSSTVAVAAAPPSVDCDSGASIGNAIITLPPGDTLLVSGTCAEHLVINGATGKFDGITLDGRGTATIRGPDTTNDTLRLEAVKGVTITGFRITGGRDGIHSRWSTDVFILNNTIENTGRNGVQVSRGNWSQISGNTIQNNPRNGIQVEESTVRIGSINEPPTPLPNIIRNNGGIGIVVSRASVARILGNTIANSTQHGIQVAKMSQADIASNTIDGNGSSGIQVTQGSGVNLGADTGTGLERTPNSSGTPNVQRGLDCALGGYADGRLGTLSGNLEATRFTESCLNSLLP